MDYESICGFESIFVGLSCKKSKILTKYNIKSLDDLFNLLLYGNDKHESLFTKMKDIKYYNIFNNGASHPHKDTKIGLEYFHKILDYQYNNIINNKGVMVGFFYYVSLYFNIHIYLDNDNNNVVIDNVANDSITCPIDILRINIESNNIILKNFVGENIPVIDDCSNKIIGIISENDLLIAYDEITKSINCTRVLDLDHKFYDNDCYDSPTEDELEMYNEYKEKYKDKSIISSII